MALENEPIQLLLASSGEEALETIRSQRPDIVLADMRLPDITGIELCETLRKNPDWALYADTPFVLMIGIYDTMQTGSKENLEEQARTSGADDVLVKPFDPKDLMRKIQELISQRPLTARPEEEETEAVTEVFSSLPKEEEGTMEEVERGLKPMEEPSLPLEDEGPTEEPTVVLGAVERQDLLKHMGIEQPTQSIDRGYPMEEISPEILEETIQEEAHETPIEAEYLTEAEKPLEEPDITPASIQLEPQGVVSPEDIVPEKESTIEPPLHERIGEEPAKMEPVPEVSEAVQPKEDEEASKEGFETLFMNPPDTEEEPFAEDLFNDQSETQLQSPPELLEDSPFDIWETENVVPNSEILEEEASIETPVENPVEEEPLGFAEQLETVPEPEEKESMSEREKEMIAESLQALTERAETPATAEETLPAAKPPEPEAQVFDETPIQEVEVVRDRTLELEAVSALKPEISAEQPTPWKIENIVDTLLRNDLFLEKLAKKIVAHLERPVLEDVAWQVVPELAEKIVKEHLRGIMESQGGKDTE